MADKFSKTHPWRCWLRRRVPWSATKPEDGFIDAGERMARTKRQMAAFVHDMRAAHGIEVVSDVYRADNLLRRERPCGDCDDGHCTMNCGPVIR